LSGYNTKSERERTGRAETRWDRERGRVRDRERGKLLRERCRERQRDLKGEFRETREREPSNPGETGGPIFGRFMVGDVRDFRWTIGTVRPREIRRNLVETRSSRTWFPVIWSTNSDGQKPIFDGPDIFRPNHEDP
jgi:hypothetical protein